MTKSATSFSTTSGMRLWWSTIVRERSIVLAAVAIVLSMSLLLWQVSSTQENLIEAIARQEADRLSLAIMEARRLYTTEVVSRAHGLEVTHDYAQKDGAIPLPATFSAMLADRLSKGETGRRVRLYSDYPFPWRKGGGPHDKFQREALLELREQPARPFFRYEDVEGRPALRYTTADVMAKACVDCHNTHPDSPKTNWKEGDVRGVLEVVVPLDDAIAQASRDFRGTFVLLFGLGLGGLIGLVAIVTKLRRKVAKAKREAAQLGQYKLEKKIGEGGMGEVYLASHAMLRRPTAIKLLRSDRGSDVDLKRFEREVQLTARLTHPNTIAVFDYGKTPDGVFYYAMEYLPGVSLDQFVEHEGPLSEGRVIYFLQQVCASLEEAHGIGLIHRDIKPANLLLCRRGMAYDVVKVLDFGLVKDLSNSDSVQLSATAAIQGTPLFLSPEQVRAEKDLDGRADLYAVGGVGYFLLTGTTVFTGKSAVEVIVHHLRTPPEPPSARLGRPISDDLEKLIMSCLEKDRDRRPANAGELLRALYACKAAGDWGPQQARDWWESNEDELEERYRLSGGPSTPGSSGGQEFAVDVHSRVD